MSDKKINDIDTLKDDSMIQEYYMDKLRAQNDEHFARTGKRKKHLTVTFGCQMNSVRCIYKHN